MNDIRNLFDVFNKLSHISNLADDIEKLRRKLKDAKKEECGYCVHWMYYPQCPREIDDNSGMKKGPACNGFACDKFQRKEWSKKHIEEVKKELERLVRQSLQS